MDCRRNMKTTKNPAGRKNMRIIRFLFLISHSSFLIFFFLSCQSVPKTPDPFINQVSSIPLESGAYAYALIDVDGSRPVLDLLPMQGIDKKQVRLILDRTDSMAVALYSPDSERRFQIAAWGSVAPSQGRLIFGASKDWKKEKCPLRHTYWNSKTGNISVAIGMRQAYAAQSAGSAPPVPCTHSSGTELPEGFSNFSRGSVMSCWIENPGAAVNKIFSELNVPVTLPAEYLYLCLFPAADTEAANSGGLYEMSVRIQTPGATQARSLVRIISLARLFSGGFSSAGILQPVLEFFFSADPVQDDKYIIIKTTPVSSRDIALLIEAISVYSKTGNQ